MIHRRSTLSPSRVRGPARLAAAALALLMLGSRPVAVRAHPADMYAQNLSLSLRPDAVELEWQILPGPFLADAVWAAADLDQSGSISTSEAEAWIQPFVSSLSAQLDSQPLQHDGVKDVRWPASVDVMRTGEDRVRFSLAFSLQPNAGGTSLLQIHSAHLEANSLIWFAVAAEDGLTFDQPAQDNGQLDVQAYFDGPGPAGAMTAWNSGTPNLGGFGAVVSRLAAGSVDPAKDGLTQSAQGGGVTATLTNLVKTQEFSPVFLGSAFLLSLLLGSLHALTPGHGKALVGAYLVGSQGRTRDAVFLGGIVTLTHTGSVVLLGVVTLFASHYILPALIAPWLEIISGVLVIGFGLNLLFRRGGDLAKWLRGRSPHAHDDHDHDHAHPHDHTHAHSHPHLHAHDGDGTAHTHAVGQPLPEITFRSLLALGVSGGLVPCPDAIAILLVAVAVNRIPFGMLLILSFSIGLALVLIGIGIAMVNGVRLISRSEAVSRFAMYAPLISAIVVTGLGAALTVSAVKSLRFGTQVVQSAAAAQTPVFDMSRARLLYIASDSTGWDQLFVRPLSGGETRQYTFEETGITGYAVSPDSGTILYTRFTLDGGTAIWALNADGGNRRLVLDCPSSECNSPRWYPDGTRLVYERLDDAAEALVPRFSIWWLDLSSGETRPLFQDAAFASYSPQFSPDGAWLSYVSSADNTLILSSLEDSSTISLPLGLQASLPAAWSPDSQYVLFGSQSDENSPLRAQIYSLVSAGITDLGGPDGASDYAAAWSPDGAWIAVNRNVPLAPGQFDNQVWLVRPDGAEARVLLQESGASYSSLAWAPDNTHLVYARYVLDLTSPTPGRFDIYMTDIESGGSELLVEGGDMPALLP